MQSQHYASILPKFGTKLIQKKLIINSVFARIWVNLTFFHCDLWFDKIDYMILWTLIINCGENILKSNIHTFSRNIASLDLVKALVNEGK